MMIAMKRLLKIFTVIVVALASIFLFPSTASAQQDTSIDCFWTFIGTHRIEDVNNDLYQYQGSTFVTIRMWRGEKTYLKAAAEGDAENCTITIDPPENKSGESAGAADAGLLKSTSAHMGFGDTESPHEKIPEIFSQQTQFPLQGKAMIWVSLDVDENAQPGRYDTELVIDADGEKKYLSIEIIVLDLSMEGDVDLDLWQYPYSDLYYYSSLSEAKPFGIQHQKALRNEMKLYKSLGGCSITAAISQEPWAHQTYYDTPSLIQWNAGADGLSFDYSQFDAWVALCMDLGIDRRIDCFSILPFDNSITVSGQRIVLEPGSEEWKYYWGTFLKDFAGHQEEKGWFEKTCIFMDERGLSHFQDAIDLIDSVSDSNGRHFMIGASVNLLPTDWNLYDQIDYLSLSIACLPDQSTALEEALSHRRELGLATTLYNCSTNYPNAFAYSDPYESVWTMLYGQAKGFSGYLRWAYNAWNDHPLQSTDYADFEAGDPWLIYPDEKDSETYEPALSTRLAMIEKGLMDVKKITWLKENAPQEITDLLDEGLSSMRRAYGIYNAYGAMVAKNDEGRRLVLQESLRIEKLIDLASRALIQSRHNNSIEHFKEEMRAVLSREDI